MKRIAVYLGARPGALASYTEAVQELGRAMAARNFGLVYGGSDCGLMGILADAVLNAGGKVFGVIPHNLTGRESVHPRVTEHIVCATMAERKCIMQYLSDGFIACPGGYGTYDEMFDILTLRQIGCHAKPFGLLNVDGFYNKLLEFLDTSVNAGFVRHEHRSMLHVNADATTLLGAMFPWTNPLSRA